ncbi:carbohydrate porin [Methylomarinum sp. Ch1-1]|uniref:Carbohydrate porin n=1 Tax=Methylomarinum roseum TaxID=3067653 RepID=A0AAU7NS44_9GAMM|nr:carbohydrate porin [Methylomarinum sp. Ch1-1]MDP4520209.1 carbohydrate porin [Methylomarinum sp. Ch1-1]
MWDFREQCVNFSIRSDDGVTILTEYGWTPKIFGRPARVYAGVINSFFEYDDFDGAGTTDHFLCFYGHADVEVAEGLRLFGVLTYSQDEVAKTPIQANIGANYKGLIPSRPDDRTIAFITYGQLSEEYGRSIGKDTDFEMVFELGHRIQIIPSFFIQPSVQYILQPGGTGDIDDAVVFGAWIGFSF